MFAPAAIDMEEMVIVAPTNDSFVSVPDIEVPEIRESVLYNVADKKCYKQADYVMFFSDMLASSIEYQKLKRLFAHHRDIMQVDFRTFFDSYKEMSAAMKPLVPYGCKCVTDVSCDDGSLYNYYEFDDKKIFFNILFDDEEGVSALVSVSAADGFVSIDGTIEETADYLRNILSSGING